MRRARNKGRQYGFTLIELLVALGIFLVVTGAAFTLLSSSQQRYQTESQVLTSFQEAPATRRQLSRMALRLTLQVRLLLGAKARAIPTPPVRLPPVVAGIARPPR